MPHHSPLSTDPQSGNAFWIILLAIALLVALTVTITKSGENTEDTGLRDRNRIQATDILRQAKSIEQAVQNMRITGTPENDISFENDVVEGYENAGCTSSCRVFHHDGAGLAYKIPPSTWLDSTKSSGDLFGEWYFYANACIPDIGTGDSNCNMNARQTELILVLPWVTRDLCIELNRLSGVENLSSPIRPPQLSGAAFKNTPEKFTGSFDNAARIDTLDERFTGKTTGCFEGSNNPTGGYHFYHVLIAR